MPERLLHITRLRFRWEPRRIARRSPTAGEMGGADCSDGGSRLLSPPDGRENDVISMHKCVATVEYRSTVRKSLKETEQL